MKKIIIAAIAVFALLIPVKSQKSQRIIFLEGFEKGMQSENLSETDSKTGNILYWNNASPFTSEHPDTAALFAYNINEGFITAPDRSASNTFVRLASSWQKLDGSKENWAMFDWKYSSTMAFSTNLIVGIQARTNSDGEWTTVSQSRGGTGQFVEEGKTKTTDINRMAGRLPDNLIAGKDSVQIAVYFDYSTNAALQFMFNVDNFSLVSLDDIKGEPRASLKLYEAPRTILDPKKDLVRVKIQSECDTIISRVKLAYTINNGNIEYQTKHLAPSLNKYESSDPIAVLLDDKLVAGSGENKIKVWIAAINLSEFYAGEGGDTLDFSIYMPTSEDSIYSTKYLVEHFTASSCGPCQGYNIEMNPSYKALEAQGKLVYVKYQMDFPGAGDPYYMKDGGARGDYYGATTIPTSFGNGTDFYGKNALQSNINKFSTKSYFNVVFDSAYISYKNASEKNIYIKYKVTSKIPVEFTLHTAVYEQITYNNIKSNGEREFPHVTMKMFPNGEGKTMLFEKDSTYEFVYEYNMAETFMERIDDMHLAVFIQNGKTKQVYQAAHRAVGADKTTVDPVISVSEQVGDSVYVEITCEDAEAEIYYTMSGENPTETSPVYSNAFWVNTNSTIKAIAKGAGSASSGMVIANIKVYVATPVIDTVAQGSDSLQVSISCATPGATIHYLLNNNAVVPSSPVYENPFIIPRYKANNVVKAMAEKAGMTNSNKTEINLPDSPETANESNANILPLNVYPNPASEYVSVESPENADIFLYNNAGILVYQGKIKASAAKKLSLTKYAKGIYMLKVVCNKGIATEKIIIK